MHCKNAAQPLQGVQNGIRRNFNIDKERCSEQCKHDLRMMVAEVAVAVAEPSL
jgi:hypothetical protein